MTGSRQSGRKEPVAAKAKGTAGRKQRNRRGKGTVSESRERIAAAAVQKRRSPGDGIPREPTAQQISPIDTGIRRAACAFFRLIRSSLIAGLFLSPVPLLRLKSGKYNHPLYFYHTIIAYLFGFVNRFFRKCEKEMRKKREKRENEGGTIKGAVEKKGFSTVPKI